MKLLDCMIACAMLVLSACTIDAVAHKKPLRQTHHATFQLNESFKHMNLQHQNKHLLSDDAYKNLNKRLDILEEKELVYNAITNLLTCTHISSSLKKKLKQERKEILRSLL